MKACRAIAPHATIVATADDNHHAEVLREEGADVAVNPNQLSAEAVVPELVKVTLHKHEASKAEGDLRSEDGFRPPA